MEKDKSKLIDIQTDVIKKDLHSGLIRTIIGSIEACECPGCLNTTQVRAGRVAKCRYCARLLEAPIILSN